MSAALPELASQIEGHPPQPTLTKDPWTVQPAEEIPRNDDPHKQDKRRPSNAAEKLNHHSPSNRAKSEPKAPSPALPSM